MKILTIIPARAGSKGIKNKNIIKIKGKPLIDYTFDLARKIKQRKLVDRIILSSDSNKIAELARKAGIEVPFLRPRQFSGDKAKAIDYVLHAIDFFVDQGVQFEAVMILQPTSPLRDIDDIKAAMNIFIRSRSSSLVSVYKESYINELVMYRKKGKSHIGLPVSKRHASGQRRQDHGGVYVRNGCIYICKVEYIKRYKRLISNAPALYEMAKMRSVNIDTEEDLQLLKRVI